MQFFIGADDLHEYLYQMYMCNSNAKIDTNCLMSKVQEIRGLFNENPRDTSLTDVLTKISCFREYLLKSEEKQAEEQNEELLSLKTANDVMSKKISSLEKNYAESVDRMASDKLTYEKKIELLNYDLNKEMEACIELNSKLTELTKFSNTTMENIKIQKDRDLANSECVINATKAVLEKLENLESNTDKTALIENSISIVMESVLQNFSGAANFETKLREIFSTCGETLVKRLDLIKDTSVDIEKMRQSEITSLKMTIEDIMKSKDESDSTVASLKLELSNMNHKFESIQKAANNSSQEELEKVYDQVESLKLDVEILENELANLQIENNAFADKIQNLNTEIERLEVNYRTCEEEKKKAQYEYLVLQTEMSDLLRRNEESNYSELLKNSEAEFAKLREKFGNVTDENEFFKTKLDLIKSELDVTNQKLFENEDNLNDKDKLVKSLEDQIRAIQSLLDSRTLELETSVEDYILAIEEIDKTKLALKEKDEQYGLVNTRLERLRDQLLLLEEDNRSLQQERSLRNEIQLRFETLENKHDQIKLHEEETKNRVMVLTETIESLRTEIETKDKEKDSNKAKLLTLQTEMEVMQHELGEYVNSLAQSKAKEEELQIMLTKRLKEITEMEIEAEKFKFEIDTFKGELTIKECEVVRLMNDINDKSDQLRQMDTKLALCHQNEEKLIEQEKVLNESVNQVHELEKIVKLRNEEIFNCKTEIEKREKQLTEMVKQYSTAACDLKKLREMETELKSFEFDLRSARNKNKQLESEKKTLLEEARAANNALFKEKANVTRAKQELKSYKENHEDNLALNEAQEDNEEEVNKLREEVKTLKEELVKTKETKDSTKPESHLTAEFNNLANEYSSLKERYKLKRVQIESANTAYSNLEALCKINNIAIPPRK